MLRNTRNYMTARLAHETGASEETVQDTVIRIAGKYDLHQDEALIMLYGSMFIKVSEAEEGIKVEVLATEINEYGARI